MSEIDYSKLGKRIRQARLKQKLSQEKLSELAGMNANYISHIENGKSKPSVQSLVNISNALNISLDYLVLDSIDNNIHLLNDDLAVLTSQFDTQEMYLAIELCKAIIGTRKFIKQKENV